MSRGVLDVRRDGAGAGGRVCPPEVANSLKIAFALITCVFAFGCFFVHELMVGGFHFAFLAYPMLGFAYLALCVPLGVCYVNHDDVRKDLNVLNPKDYVCLCRRVYGAFLGAKDGKVRGKDL